MYQVLGRDSSKLCAERLISSGQMEMLIDAKYTVLKFIIVRWPLCNRY